jgi:nucleotide-binding universal stress UspA family protein
MPRSRVLIAYDGSDRARRAIRVAAATLAEADAVVLHVGALPTPAPPGLPFAGAPVPWEPPDEAAALAAERQALDVATEGAREAKAAGLTATPAATVAGGGGAVAEAIVRSADEHDAGLIVMGSHGHSVLRQALLGSVSAGVLSHTGRPVLVVPDPHRS